MKSKLISKYYLLKMARINASDSLDKSLVSIDMMRIDTILFQRYGYDVSLTRKN